MGLEERKESRILVTMEIVIRDLDRYNDVDFGQCDNSFTVKSKLILRAEDGRISYTIVDVLPYIKSYGVERTDYAEYADSFNHNICFAYINEELAGQTHVQSYWNKYAYISDLIVDTKYRRQGVGRALIEHNIQWAQAKGLSGIVLETQNNNVAACKFYESCGFELRGFDTHLYKGLNPATDEIALYWYLIF